MSLPLLLRPARKRWRYDLTAGVLPPVLSVARASTATYIAASGLITSAAANAARFDCDPITHAVRGLLLEPQTTYLAAPSEDVAASPWGLNNGLTNTAVTSDSPLRVADSLNRLGGGSQPYSAAQYSVAPSSSPITQHWLIRNVDAVASRIVHRDNSTAVQINLVIAWASATAGAAIVSLTPSTGAGVVCTAYTATAFGGGWWLVAATFTFALNGANVLRIDPAQTTLGRSVDVAAAWGTYSAEPRSYAQITESAVTRDADVVTLLDTSRASEITYVPLGSSTPTTYTVAAGAQPPSTLYGHWTRVRQL